jgi:hypothetical protein
MSFSYETQSLHPAVTKADLLPLTDILRKRHGWSYFDFKITSDMAAFVSGSLDVSKILSRQWVWRSYLRSMKRPRRWLRLDQITYFDELLKPNDPILFEKAGFDYPTRRGSFEVWDKAYGVESLDRYLGSKETSDESIFDRVVTIKNLGDFDFTVAAADKLWRVHYRVLSFTPNVYLKL